jgi:hypothetical protein
MVDTEIVRTLALALPETVMAEQPDTLDFSVGAKGFAWTWRERAEPKKPRRLRPDVLAVRCTMERKQVLLEAAPHIFFDDDHYRGYPAVLVRLAEVEAEELASLLEEGWAIQAPKKLVKAHASTRGPSTR